MTVSTTRPQFIAVDVETTLNGNEDVGLAHPMHPDNRVVHFGITDSTGKGHAYCDDPDMFEVALKGYSPYATYCGHNFSFDLLYLYKTKPSMKDVLQASKIWDTQLAEYILTGQRSKFSSLDELSIKYGLPLKDDKLKTYFTAGIGSDKIPLDEIVPYLKQDVENTYAIAYKQWNKAVEQDQLPLILSQMEALQATAEMMYNGLHIDKAALDSYTVEVVNEYVKVKLDLEEHAAGLVEDINSPKQWSQCFFGGKKKTMVKKPVGMYKNGKVKTKLTEEIITISPMVDYTPDPDKVSDKTGQISVDDDVLTDMMDHIFNPRAKVLIQHLLKYRELSKQLSTYVQGLSKHVMNDHIYGKLNHTATVTGRLSSTSPNLQNISNNPIKQIFTSRYEGGYIVEVDFSQLEVVALAHVTRDTQLITDIVNGGDIHSMLYKDMFGRMPTKEERKPFKARSFQLIYGAGAKAIAKSAKCSFDEAKKFVDVFYKRYPQVADWHRMFAAIVDKDAKHLVDSKGLLEKFRTCVYTAETGRRFVFTEYFNDSTWSPKMYNFSPTELKNYPVQSLATGDIVPMMLGVLFRKFLNKEGILLVNTIHDSVMFDVTKEAVVEFIMDVQEVFQDTDKYFKETFKHPLALKLNASVSYGINWFSMEEVK
jgi:DNA polymerase I-like protein with 3'-5' exonuclease and polymerase domains